MECVNHTDAIVEYRVFVFDQRVRWQPTFAFPDAHRAAGWMKPQAYVTGGRDSIVQTAAIWIKV